MEFTKEQVAKHNSLGDCWVTLRGDVLDLSKFDDHPGKLAYVRGAGGDIEDLMASIHKGQGHSDKAYEWAKAFKIGTLAD